METPTSTGIPTEPEPIKPWKQVAEEGNIFSLPAEQRVAEYDKWSQQAITKGIRDGDFDSPDMFDKFKVLDIRTRRNLASDDIVGPSDEDILADYKSYKNAFKSTQQTFASQKPTPEDNAIQGEVLQGKRNAAFVRGQMVFNPTIVNDPQKYREAILESDAPPDIKMLYAGLRPEMEKSATVTRRRELANSVITRDVADKVVNAIQEGTEVFGADIGTPQSPALKKNKAGVWSVVDPEYVDMESSMLEAANARYNPLADAQYKPLAAINEYQKKYGLSDEQVQQDYMEALIENAPTAVNRWVSKATSVEDYVKQLDSTVRVKNKDVAPEVRVQDPNLFFDAEGYNAAVDKANAPEEAKNLAKEARTQFADAVAGDIYNNLLANRDDFREDYAKDVVKREDMAKAITRYYKDKKDQAWYDDVGEFIGQGGTALQQGGMNVIMTPSAVLGMFGSVKDAEDVRYATMVQNGQMQAEEAVANRTGGAGAIKLTGDVARILPDLAVQMAIGIMSGGALSYSQAAALSARTGISKAAARTAIRQAAITGEKAALKTELVKLIPNLSAQAADDVATGALEVAARTMSNNPLKGGVGTQRAIGSAYAGLTSAGMTFGQVYTEVRAMGKSPEESIGIARTAGITAGAITGALTHAFGVLGRGGVEDFASMGRKAGEFTIRDIMKSGVRDVLTTQEGRQLARSIASGIAKDSLHEGVEEGLDQALNLISQYATNPSPEAQNRKVSEVINESLYGMLLGIIAGGGANVVGQARVTAPGITAQQMQAEILGASVSQAGTPVPAVPQAAPQAQPAAAPQAAPVVPPVVPQAPVVAPVVTPAPVVQPTDPAVQQAVETAKAIADVPDTSQTAAALEAFAKIVETELPRPENNLPVVEKAPEPVAPVNAEEVPVEQPAEPVTVEPTAEQPTEEMKTTKETPAARDATKPEQMTPEKGDEVFVKGGDDRITRRIDNIFTAEGKQMVLLQGLQDPIPLDEVVVDPKSDYRKRKQRKAEQTARMVAANPQLIRQLGDLAVRDKQPVSQDYINATGGGIPEGYVKEGELYVFKGEEAPAAEASAEKPVPEAEMARGDRFKDSSGQEYEVWKNRQGTIEAHPVVDGKSVVNRESAVRFSVSDAAKMRNPEDRTDIAATSVVSKSEVEAAAAPAPEKQAKPKPDVDAIKERFKGKSGYDKLQLVNQLIESGELIPAAFEAAETGKVFPAIPRGVTLSADTDIPNTVSTDRIPAPKIKATTPEKAAELGVSDDKARRILNGVFLDAQNQKAVSSDGRILIAIPAKITGEDRVISANDIPVQGDEPAVKAGGIIKGNYPPWKQVVPRPESKGFEIDPLEVIKGTVAVDGVNKTFKDATVGSVYGAVIGLIKVGDAYFDHKYIKKTLTAILQSGATKITAQVDDEVSPLLLTGDNGAIAVVMPVRLGSRTGRGGKSVVYTVTEKKAQPKPTKPDAVQKPKPDEGVLRQEGQGVGLPEVDQGGRGAEQESAKQAEEVKSEKLTTIEKRALAIANLKGTEPRAEGMTFVPDKLMTSARRASLRNERETRYEYDPRGGPLIEIKRFGEVIGDPARGGWLIIDRRITEAERRVEAEKRATAKTQPEPVAEPELTPQQQDVVAFMEDQNDETEERQKPKKKKITPGEARKAGTVEILNRLRIQSNDPESVIGALKKIAESKDAPKHHVRIAKDLLSVLEGSGTSIVLVASNDPRIKKGDERVNGWYDSQTNTAYINLDGPHELGITETILHELVHASGEKIIRNPQTDAQKRILGDLQKQMEAATKNAIAFGQSVLKTKETDLDKLIALAASDNNYALFDILYGVSSLSEYHAHATTSKAFQRFLSEYKEGSKRNFFERFVNSLTRLLSGQKTVEGSDAEKSYATLLDLMRENKGDVRLSNTDVVQSRARGVVTTDMDAAFADAYAKGDTESAQEMVNEAAKAAGYTVGPVYHHGGFDAAEDPTPRINEEGMHFGTKDAATQRAYGKQVDDFIKDGEIAFDEDVGAWFWSSQGIDSVDIIDEDGFTSEEDARQSLMDFASSGEEQASAEELGTFTMAFLRAGDAIAVPDQADSWVNAVAKAKAKGVESIKYKNLFEDKGSTSYIVFSPEQIKSADPFTFDDAGNLIPLSQRFNPASQDIRFSRARGVESDSAHTELERRFKAGDKDAEQEAKALVEETAKQAGWTEKAYHGTPGGGFTVFDIYGSRYGLMGQGAYFTDARDIAQSYADKQKRNVNPSSQTPMVYEVFLKPGRVLDMEAPVNTQFWLDAFGDYLTEDSLSEAKTNEDAFRALEEALTDEGVSMSEGSEIVSDGLMSRFDSVKHIGGKRMGKGENLHNVTIIFNSEQIKSADAFTYDDDGNLIPLSERFTEQSPDIRYSKARGIVSDAVVKFAPQFNVVDTPDGPSVEFDGRSVTVNPEKLANLEEYEMQDLANRAVVAAIAAPKDPIAAGIIQQTMDVAAYNFDSESRKGIRKGLADAHRTAHEFGMAPLAMELGNRLFEFGGATDADVRKSAARGIPSDEEYMAAVEAGDMEAAQRMVDNAVRDYERENSNRFDIEDKTLGARYRGMEGYGVWMTRDGRVIPVENHTQTAKNFFKSKNSDYALQDAFGRGWAILRAIKAGDYRWDVATLAVEGNETITNTQRKNINDWAKAHGYEINWDLRNQRGVPQKAVIYTADKKVVPLSKRFRSDSPIPQSRARGTELVTRVSGPALALKKFISGFRSRGMVSQETYDAYRDSDAFKKANQASVSFWAKDMAKITDKLFGEGDANYRNFRVFYRDPATGEASVSFRGFDTRDKAEAFAVTNRYKDYIVSTGNNMINMALGSNEQTLKEDVSDAIEKLTKKGLDDIAKSIEAYKEEYLDYWNTVMMQAQPGMIDPAQIATLRERREQWMAALRLRSEEQKKLVDDARKEAVVAALADAKHRVVQQQKFAKAYLPDDLVHQIERGRGAIDKLSSDLRGIKWLMEGSENEMIIEGLDGIYVTRSYEAFETSDKAKYVAWLNEAYNALTNRDQVYDPIAMERIMPLVRHIKNGIMERRIEDLKKESDQRQVDAIMEDLMADSRQVTQVDRVPGQPIEGTEYEKLIQAVAKQDLLRRRSDEKKKFLADMFDYLNITVGFASNIGDRRKRETAIRKEAKRLYSERYGDAEQQTIAAMFGRPQGLQWAVMTDDEAHDIANVERALSESPANLNGSEIWRSDLSGETHSSFYAAVNAEFKSYLDYIAKAPFSKTGANATTTENWRRLNDKILEHKSDIPAFLRTLWGEKDNPLLRVSDTILKQSNLVAVGKLYDGIAEIGKKEGWLIEEKMQATDAKYTGWVSVLGSKDNDQGYRTNPLAGKVTDPVMAEAISKLLEANQPSNSAFKVISFVVGASLWNVTAGSVRAIARNLYSLPIFLMNSGILGAVINPTRWPIVAKNIVLALRIVQQSMEATGDISGGKQITNKGFKFLDWLWTGLLSVIGAQRPALYALRGAATIAELAGRIKEQPTGEAFQEIYLKAVRLGVANDNVQKEAIHKLLDIEEQAIRSPKDKNMGRFAKALKLEGTVGFGSYLLGTVKSTLQQRSQLYGAPDDFTKIMAWLNEMDTQANIHAKDDAQYKEWCGEDGLFSKMPDEFVKKAADNVTNLIQSHSRVWAHITQFKKAGFGALAAPFAAARAEFYRNAANAYIIAFEEMRSKNKKEQMNGGIRFASALMAHLAMGNAIGAVVKTIFSAFADDDEIVEGSPEYREAVRKLGPEYAKNKNATYILYKNGTFDWVDLSFANPFAFVWDSITAARRGATEKDVEDNIVVAMSKEILEENIGTFAKPQIALDAFATIRTGYDPVRGVKIWDSQADSFTDKLEKSVSYYLKQAGAPGDYKDAMKILKAAHGVEENGRQYKLGTEVGAVFLGTSIRTVNITDALEQKLAQAKDTLGTRITPLYKAPLRNANDVEMEDVALAVQQYAKAHDQAVSTMQKSYKAAETLLRETPNAKTLLRNVMSSDRVRMSQEVERAIVTGKPSFPGFSDQTLQKVKDLGKKHDDDRAKVMVDTLKEYNQKKKNP